MISPGLAARPTAAGRHAPGPSHQGAEVAPLTVPPDPGFEILPWDDVEDTQQLAWLPPQDDSVILPDADAVVFRQAFEGLGVAPDGPVE